MLCPAEKRFAAEPRRRSVRTGATFPRLGGRAKHETIVEKCGAILLAEKKLLSGPCRKVRGGKGLEREVTYHART